MTDPKRTPEELRKARDEGPLGQRIRNLIRPVLEDESHGKTQLKILNDFFEDLADFMPGELEKGFKALFNKVASKEKDERFSEITTAMTKHGDKFMGGAKAYEGMLKKQLPLITDFSDFRTEDIKELPGYIRFHEVMRDLDIAVRFSYILGEDIKSLKGLSNPPTLVFDVSVPYEDGALDARGFYPDLPPPGEKGGKKANKPGSFDHF